MPITKTTEKTVKFTPINNPFNFTNNTKRATTISDTTATVTNVRESFFDKYPELPQVEERQLVERMLHGDKQAYDELIVRCRGYVNIAVRQFNNFPIEKDMLVSIGLEKLCKVVTKYDPSKGARLSTYVVTCVKNEIINELAKIMYPVPIPRNLVLLIPKINKERREFYQESGLEPDIEWLSLRTGISETTILSLFALGAPIRLDEDDEDDDSHKRKRKVIVRTTEDEGLSKAEIEEAIMYLFSTISDRDRVIVKMRFGFYDKDYSLEEISKEVGLSKEGVRQVINKVTKKFRKDPRFNELFA